MAVYTVFAQTGGATIAGDSSEATLGMQFSLSANAALTGIWFYSPATAADLPVSCCIYQVTGTGTGSQVSGTVNTSPTWSGAVASGWVKCTYNGATTLNSGTNYKVVVHHNPGGNWYSATSHYWDTGAGSGGVTGGIITAPNNAGGDQGQDTFIVAAGLGYPNSSFNATNYWVDVEVTATSAVTVSPSSLSVTQASSGTFGVSLPPPAPGGNVTVTTAFTSGNTGLSITSGGSLTFTPGNYATPQNVTIAADQASTGAAVFTASAASYSSSICTVTEAAGTAPVRAAFLALFP